MGKEIAMSVYLMPMCLILLGVVALSLYIVTAALRATTDQLNKINERLLVIIGVQGGGTETGRALVALAKPPLKANPGVAEKDKAKKKPKEGVRMTYGGV